MGEPIRIGERLFNLDHVISIEPAEGASGAIDINVLPGRAIRLTGDDARAASFFVTSHPALPVDQAAQDKAEEEQQAAQDHFMVQMNRDYDKISDPRRP